MPTLCTPAVVLVILDLRGALERAANRARRHLRTASPDRDRELLDTLTRDLL